MGIRQKRLIALCMAAVLTTGSTGLEVFAASEREGVIQNSSENAGLLYEFDMEGMDGDKITNKVTNKDELIVGEHEFVDGKIGEKALKFDGTTYVNLGKDYQPSNEYTLMGWIKQDEGATDGQVIFSRSWSGDIKEQLALMVKGGTVYHAVSVSDDGISNSKFSEFSTGAVAPMGKWNHIAVTRSESKVTVYVNGESVYEKTDLSAAGFATSNHDMYIGVDCNSSGQVYNQHSFKGVMDELRMYDTELTSESIKESYDEGIRFMAESISNGEVILQMQLPQDVELKKDDFRLSYQEGAKVIEPTITKMKYDEETQNVVLSFDALSNLTNKEKIIDMSITYKGDTIIGQVILPKGNNQSPQVNEVSIKNISPKLGAEPHVKGMLEVNYKYSDPEGEEEGDTKYQWYSSDSLEGEYTPIEGIRTRTVILLDKYVGKYLKCEVTAADINGNTSEPIFSPATTTAVQATEGNPLTDWFYEAGYGVSHHFLSNYFNLNHVFASLEEKWDRSKMTWNEFVGQFDAEEYAKQISEAGAKYVLLTLGQNSGSYCAPNPVYDKYMREAGLIGEDEPNPKTVSMENDLPMKIAKELRKYGIRLMLYLPSNPPHSASWDETGTPNGYGYFSDYLVTTKVFDYTPGTDGVPSQRARKVLSEMVEWWSEHYGDYVSGWWFDGMYYGGVFEGQNDMSKEYNIASLANAAKAGNPYSIVTFNQGLNVDVAFKKTNDYQDYTAGESQGMNTFNVDGRWATGKEPGTISTDCQNFMFGPIGNRNNWSAGWGCKGTSRTPEFLIETVKAGRGKDWTIGFDTKVNIHGEIDPEQLVQLKEVKAALGMQGVAVTGIELDIVNTKMEVGTSKQLTPTIVPEKATNKNILWTSDNELVARVSNTGLITAVSPGTAKIMATTEDGNKTAECIVEVTKVLKPEKVGWIEDKTGWWYRHADGSYTKNNWEKIDNKWYYFNAKGYMKTGWVQSDNKWFFMKDNGAMATGWIKADNKWYYLKSNGVMATGWIKVDNKWYYLKSNGAMATGWIKIDSKWFYLKANGVMATDWIKVDNKWYYLKENGVMATGWVLSGNKWYFTKNNGVMATGWTFDGKKTYYLNKVTGAWNGKVK